MSRAGSVGVIVIALVAAVYALGTLGIPAATYRDGDFLQFWIQPQAFFEGADPYDPIWWSAMHARVGARPLFPEAVYPPYDALAFLPLALLPLGYAAAAWVVGQLAAVLVVGVALARRIADPGGRWIFVAAVAAFQPLWLLAVGGNVTGLLVAAVGGAYLAALDGRVFRCGALLGVLVVKPHPFLFLAVAVLLLVEASQRRRLVLGTLATAGPLLIVSLLLRPSWYAQWLAAAFGLQSEPGSNATVWTLGRIVGPELPVVGGFAAAVVITTFVLWSRRVRPSFPLGLAGAIPASLAVAPHGWSYDQLLLLVPLAMTVDRIGASTAPRRVARGALVLVSTALPWLLYLLAFRRGGEELSAITPIAVLALVICLFGRRTPMARRGPAAALYPPPGSASAT